LYANPGHPYTIGLLASLPRLNDDNPVELEVIPGQPPNQLALPPGCPFAERCAFQVEKCLEKNPPLEAFEENHAVACWEKETINLSRSHQ